MTQQQQQQQQQQQEKQPTEKSTNYSVYLIGSSGGGTATLGHTDPVELITSVHRELLRIRDVKNDGSNNESNGDVGGPEQQPEKCIGLSKVIFVSLDDGSGLDSVKKQDWLPTIIDAQQNESVISRGPTATLYTVGFEDKDNQNINNNNTLNITKAAQGPLSKINQQVKIHDEKLATHLKKCNSAIISMSSEPTILHASSLKAAAASAIKGESSIPITGSGGTSLSQIASLYNLPIVGNAGGSVASTSTTKARGWAVGLAKEWGMRYDRDYYPVFQVKIHDTRTGGTVTRDSDAGGSASGMQEPIPSLKSILEAALPTFLFVSIVLRFMSTLGESSATHCNKNTAETALGVQGVCTQQTSMFSTVEFALRFIVPGTTCCILAATSRSGKWNGSSFSNNSNPTGDQSTLLLAATLAGIIASASSAQSTLHFLSFSDGRVRPNEGQGGSALAGLIAGSLIPHVFAFVSNACNRYHVTATMTNILLGGGVGMLVGAFVHLSGLAYALSLVTGLIRCMLRWEIVGGIMVRDNAADWTPTYMVQIFIGQFVTLFGLAQKQWIEFAELPGWEAFFYSTTTTLDDATTSYVPVPRGVGFLYGCFVMYGSKIGLYHSLFLPLILLEMDSSKGEESASILGAMDECTLVMVCAGICAANLMLPPSKTGGEGHKSLAWQAVKTNILCGDFIEAAYPYMEESKIINGSSYLAAGLSSEILLRRRVFSTAYMPLPLAIWISNDWLGMTIACGLSFFVSMFGTCFFNLRFRVENNMD